MEETIVNNICRCNKQFCKCCWLQDHCYECPTQKNLYKCDGAFDWTEPYERQPVMEKTKQSQWLITAQLCYQIQQERKSLEQKEKELFAQLKALSENKTRHEGEFIYMKEMRSGSIEYAAIDILKEVNLELFRKPSVETWKLIRVAE